MHVLVNLQGFISEHKKIIFYRSRRRRDHSYWYLKSRFWSEFFMKFWHHDRKCEHGSVWNLATLWHMKLPYCSTEKGVCTRNDASTSNLLPIDKKVDFPHTFTLNPKHVLWYCIAFRKLRLTSQIPMVANTLAAIRTHTYFLQYNLAVQVFWHWGGQKVLRITVRLQKNAFEQSHFNFQSWVHFHSINRVVLFRKHINFWRECVKCHWLNELHFLETIPILDC